MHRSEMARPGISRISLRKNWRELAHFYGYGMRPDLFVTAVEMAWTTDRKLGIAGVDYQGFIIFVIVVVTV